MSWSDIKALTLDELMIELGEPKGNDVDAAGQARQYHVQRLLDLAKSLDLTPKAFAALGADRVAAITSDRIGKIVKSASIAPILAAPEFQ